jgi:hypothetical protein
MHRWIAFAIAAHQLRQQVLDGRSAGGDHQLAGSQTFDARLKIPLERFPSLDQRPGQFVECLAGFGQIHAPAAPFQQGHAEFPFQRLQLQADRRLRQEQRFGRPAQAAELDDVHEGAQLLEAVALVVEAQRFGRGRRSAACRNTLWTALPGQSSGLFGSHFSILNYIFIYSI